MIRKELAVAAIVSAVLAAANGLRIYLQYHDSAIALVISLSLAATVVLAKLVGCMLPIAAKQLHMDPAIMASPLITTIVDAGAVLIYFQAAAALLRLPFKGPPGTGAKQVPARNPAGTCFPFSTFTAGRCVSRLGRPSRRRSAGHWGRSPAAPDTAPPRPPGPRP